MERQTRIRIGELVWPLFAVVGFIFKLIDKTLLAWWLGPLLQKKANKALLDDLQANLYFLYTKGQPVGVKQVLPFDYASVYITYDNVRFCFTRGRGELNVSLSPIYAPQETYLLSVVIAALDGKDITEVAPLSFLSEVGNLLRERLDDLNAVFSKRQYPEFRKKLSAVKERVRILTRQAEWNLNRAIYH